MQLNKCLRSRTYLRIPGVNRDSRFTRILRSLVRNSSTRTKCCFVLCFAVACTLVRELFMTADLYVFATFWMCLVFPLGVLATSWPFLSAKHTTVVCLHAFIGLVATGPIASWLFHGNWSDMLWWCLYAGHAAVFSVVLGLLSLLLVVIRHRYWPVYPAGCCRNCGYDLRGLSEQRCPECGTSNEKAIGGSDAKPSKTPAT